MDSPNDDFFSPLKNADEETKKRRSDSFSKFLKGPDAFKKSSTETGLCSDESSLQPGTTVVSEASGYKEIKKTHHPSSLCKLKSLSEGNVNVKTLSIKGTSSKKSSKTFQDKSTENGAKKAEVLSLSSPILDDVFVTYLESSCSLKKVDEADNLQSGYAKKNKDFPDASLTAKYNKQIKDQQNEAQCKSERKHSSNSNMLQLHAVESSVQSRTSVTSEASRSKEIQRSYGASSSSQHGPLSQLHSVKSSVESEAAMTTEASGSEEIKKTHHPSSLSQHNPFSQIQSRIEKLVSNAVDSQVDNLQQLMWSHHFSLLKALYETKETLEHKHVSERETLCKMLEELAEENRQLRNAASGHK